MSRLNWLGTEDGETDVSVARAQRQERSALEMRKGLFLIRLSKCEINVYPTNNGLRHQRRLVKSAAQYFHDWAQSHGPRQRALVALDAVGLM